MRLLALFIVVPIIEIYLLIQVGGVIGALPTIGLILLTAIVGAAMLRQQGLATLNRARHHLDAGQLPARELLEGMILVFGGALLLTPGFVTDTLGFFCLLPQTRGWLINGLGRHMVVRQVHGARPPGAGPGARHDSRIIEGEWRRDDE